MEERADIHQGGAAVSPGSKIALALFVLALLTTLPYYIVKHDSAQEHQRLQGEVAQLQTQNDEIRRENTRMEEHLADLQADPERYARERLVLARPHEVILSFPEEPAAPVAAER
jgi:cell division protein FtsB